MQQVFPSQGQSLICQVCVKQQRSATSSFRFFALFVSQILSTFLLCSSNLKVFTQWMSLVEKELPTDYQKQIKLDPVSFALSHLCNTWVGRIVLSR